MTPARFRGRGSQSPQERAAADEAAKRFELDEASFGGGSEAARERGEGPNALFDSFDSQTTGLSLAASGGSVRIRPVGANPLGPSAPGVLGDELDTEQVAELAGEVDVPSGGGPEGKRTPRWRQMLEVFFQNKLAVISVVVLLAIVLFVYVGPMFYKTNQTNTNAILSSLANQPPSSQHPLGTDITGWDVLGRIMYGGKYSLTLGFLAGLITIVVGEEPEGERVLAAVHDAAEHVTRRCRSEGVLRAGRLVGERNSGSRSCSSGSSCRTWGRRRRRARSRAAPPRRSRRACSGRTSSIWRHRGVLFVYVDPMFYKTNTDEHERDPEFARQPAAQLAAPPRDRHHRVRRARPHHVRRQVLAHPRVPRRPFNDRDQAGEEPEVGVLAAVHDAAEHVPPGDVGPEGMRAGRLVGERTQDRVRVRLVRLVEHRGRRERKSTIASSTTTEITAS